MGVAEKHLTDILSVDTMTDAEVIRALRLSIEAEYDAVNLYQQIADATTNELVKKVMLDIANEERQHVGEFLKVLQELDSEEMKYYDEGVREVEVMIAGEEAVKETPTPGMEISYAASNSMNVEGKDHLKKMFKTVQDLNEELDEVIKKK
jgi:rubrerythrin